MPDKALRSSEALMRRSAAIVSAMMLLAMITLLSSCGSGQTAAAERTASATPSTSPTPALSSQQLRRVVHAYALKIGAEEGRAPCQASSNPYDYVKYCPTFPRLVALGPPALPVIAHEIESADGLDAYLLAIAGDAIWGRPVPVVGIKSWATADQWARQYRAWAKEHPSGT